MKKQKEQNLYVKDAQFYDLDNRDVTKADIPFFLDYATSIQGDILELACGTGRLTIPLAQSGHEVWGIELSKEMLRQFEFKLKGFSEEIVKRIHLFKADMSRFSLKKKFPLIIIPYRSFQLLYDEKIEIACLNAVFDHLEDKGRFIIDIGDFVGDKEETWVNDEEVFDWENIDHRTGYKVRRTHIKKEIDKTRQIIYPQKNFYVMNGDFFIEKIVKKSIWKYFKLEQIKRLITESGFEIIKEMGSYDGKPIGEGTEFIFICRKAGSFSSASV